MQVREEKPLVGYSPEEIIIKTNDLCYVLDHNEDVNKFTQKKDNSVSRLISSVFVVGTTIANLISWNELSAFLKIINITLGIIFFVVLVISIYSFKDAKKELQRHEAGDKGSTLILNKAKQNTLYSIIIIIGEKEESAPIKFLCRRSDAFLEHCAADATESISGNTKTLKQHLWQQYGISEEEIIDIHSLEDEPRFSVKKVHGETKSNAFLFYCVRFHKTAKEKVLDRVKMSNELEWLSIEEMKSNPEAMKNNYDIITVLDQNIGQLSESFPKEELHVIWNITKKCKYNCAICATRDDNRKELTCEQKHIVLSALSRARDRIRSIDFAGGDPCTDSESRGVIETAIAILGNNSVSVTTTANAINQLPQDDKIRILQNCEITIDASHESLSNGGDYGNHRGSNYSKSNREQIPLFSDVVRRLTINIPILDDDLSDDEINSLVDIVKKIKRDNRDISVETHLIRLMRVGNSAKYLKLSEYQSYDPITVADKIYSRLNNNGITCSYHCSLRALNTIGSSKNCCTMMERKIGIDCAGNVFACAWGGYLPVSNVKDNPFYLGNLLSQQLTDILDRNTSNNYKTINSLLRREKGIKYCPVASIACGGTLYENRDPLAKASRKKGNINAN